MDYNFVPTTQLNELWVCSISKRSLLNTDTLWRGVSILFTPTLSTDKSTYLLAQVLLTLVGTMFPTPTLVGVQDG